MTELELQNHYCVNCERPNCYQCEAFAAHMRTELGYDEHDTSDDYCDDDVDVPSLSEREKYELQCEIDETAADLYMNF